MSALKVSLKGGLGSGWYSPPEGTHVGEGADATPPRDRGHAKTGGAKVTSIPTFWTRGTAFHDVPDSDWYKGLSKETVDKMHLFVKARGLKGRQELTKVWVDRYKNAASRDAVGSAVHHSLHVDEIIERVSTAGTRSSMADYKGVWATSDLSFMEQTYRDLRKMSKRQSTWSLGRVSPEFPDWHANFDGTAWAQMPSEARDRFFTLYAKAIDVRGISPAGSFE